MEKPDFGKYSEIQLRQILTRIDHERFPDRVEEIHARLAQLDAARPARDAAMVAANAPAPGPHVIAGPWRRTAAFVVDTLILALVGWGLGRALQGPFEALGGYGLLVGFGITVAYFGIMESRLFQGHTLGKLALDIRVMTTAGTPLRLRSALLRAAVFHAPYFLNGASAGAGAGGTAVVALASFLVFGLGVSIGYLLLFNRRTRQSVHDLLVGAVVVRASGTGVPVLAPVWRGHLAALGAMAAVGVGAGGYMVATFGQGTLQPLADLQQQVVRLPGVRSAGVVTGVAFASSGTRTRMLTVQTVANADAGDANALARRIADIVFTTYPPARQVDMLSVTVRRGYDIGIGSRWTTVRLDMSPAEWLGKRVTGN